MDSTLSLVLALIFGGLLTLAILARPYLGLVFTLATQPVLDLLAEIPYVNLILPLMGAVTVAAYAFSAKNSGRKNVFRLSGVMVLALFLIFWILFSHPQAALFGRDRNWLFTFFQLWVLIWLAGVLLDTPKKHQVLMWAFSVTTLASAVAAISQGGFLEEIDVNLRTTGLAQGSNTAARYFVVSFIFLFYLRTVSRHRVTRFLAAFSMVVTFLGVFYTASRTGMVILGAAVLLLFLLQSRFKYRLQITVIAAIALLVLVVFSASIFAFMGGIGQSVSHGTDTMGLRYALWEAGWEMFLDHPLSGVGIGNFSTQLRNYPQPIYTRFFYKQLVAHNMYISMLAETGTVGILLFMGMILKSLANFITAGRTADPGIKALRNTWLVVFIAILLGGMTKTDQVDKLFWISMGISAFLPRLATQQVQEKKGAAAVIHKSGAELNRGRIR